MENVIQGGDICIIRVMNSRRMSGSATRHCGGRSKFLHSFSHKTLNERAAGKPDVHMLG